MVTGSVMTLIAAVFLGIGIYTIRTGRVPGPSWLRSIWRGIPPWRIGIGFVAVGVSTSLWEVSVLTGNTWAPVLASLVTGAAALFEVIMREREASRRKVNNRRVWYRMPSALDGTDAVANGSGWESTTKGDTKNQV